MSDDSRRAGKSSGSRARGRSTARRQSLPTRETLEPPPNTRQSRRRSVGPYPTRAADVDGGAAESGAEDASHQEPVEEAGEEEYEPVASGSGTRTDSTEDAIPEAGPSSATGLPASAFTGQFFELKVLQQPEVGTPAGLDRMALGRLPIIPATVVQVIVKNGAGEVVDIELPYLFCTCALKQEDGVTPVHLTLNQVEQAVQGPASLSALLGSLVRNAHKVTDLDGKSVSVFVFEDMSVREGGRYTLEFRLGEAATTPKSPRLASVVSDPFDVVAWEQYPGRSAEDILTPFSRHLMDQKVPLYVPPLVLASETASPIPPGQNPWPPTQLPFDDTHIPLPSNSPSLSPT